MKKQNTQLLSAVSALLVLSGCSFSGNAVQPQKTPEVPVVPAANKQESDEQEYINLAELLFENRDGIAAFEIFKEYAGKGNPEAQAWLGRCYLQEIGTPSDINKAYEYFSKAAEKNNPWGLNGLAVMTQFGIGTTANLPAAIELYKKAAEQELPLAFSNLAQIYANEENGCYNPALAETYFKKAIEHKSPQGGNAYAKFLYEQKRYAEVVSLCQTMPDSTDAMILLADCFLNGRGTPVNISKATALAEKVLAANGPAEWSRDILLDASKEEVVFNGMNDRGRHLLKLAAEAGHPEAQFLYGSILADAKDTDTALSFMLKSADSGFREAALKAGEMLAEKARFTEAIKYYMIASLEKENEKNAVVKLSDLYHTKLNQPKTGHFWDVRGMALDLNYCRNEIALKELFTDGDEHFVRAAALFAEGVLQNNKFADQWLTNILKKEYDRLRLLADKNTPDALFALGVVGWMEEDKHPEATVGVELLQRAAELKHPVACRILGRMYLNGNPQIKKDLKKALDWFQKGAEYNDPQSARMASLMLFYEEIFKKTPAEEVKKAFERALELETFSVAFEYAQYMEQTVKDQKKAKELYELAAAHDDPRAMLRLHYLLFETETEMDKAAAYLRKAIELQHAEANLRLGYLQDLVQEPRRAFICYLNSKINDENAEANFKLAECLLNGYGCEVNHQAFLACAEKTYQDGHADVCYLLGTVYRDGKIGPKDSIKAKAYFKEGAKRGSAKCKNAL